MIKILLKNQRTRRILLLVLISFFIILGVLSFLFYSFTLYNFEQSELMKLKGIANSISLQIDGDELHQLTQRYKNKDDITRFDQDSIYLKIHSTLKSNMDANMLKSPIYTLFKDSGNDYLFGVTSQVQPYYRHVYESTPSLIIEMYMTGGILEPYKDNYGEWLSAFTPLTNDKGESIGLLMVDEKLESFREKATRQTYEALLYAFLIFSLMYGLLFYILAQILSKENKDKLLLEQSNLNNIQMSQQLQQANEKLNIVSDLRKEMIANLSHDLRTPLTSTIGYLELVKDKKELPADQKNEYVEIAYKEANKLKIMVADLFELSKLESGYIALNKEPFLVQELISDVVQKYKFQLEAKHIEMNFDFHEVGLAFGDIKYLERVFQNLLDNAVRYVYKGGFIKLSVLDKEDDIIVKVCNIGDPISKEDQGSIFDRYYKSGSKSGSGLGLAISKKICQMHDCDITLEVNENINSFYFTIEKYKA